MRTLPLTMLSCESIEIFLFSFKYEKTKSVLFDDIRDSSQSADKDDDFESGGDVSHTNKKNLVSLNGIYVLTIFQCHRIDSFSYTILCP